jgi:hypothetical protein
MLARFFAFIGTIAVCGVLLAPPVSAATPQGSCPKGFPPPIAISALPADLQEFATFLDTEVGGNNDGLICVTTIAAKSQGSKGAGLNILDNRVAGY